MTDMPPPSDPADTLIIPLPPLPDGTTRQIIIRPDELHWQFARSGGPGGQNVNKVATKALLRWNPRASSTIPADVRYRLLHLARSYLLAEGDLLLTSQRHRTQLMNMQDCLDKLRQLILAAIPPPKIRHATRPTRGSKERRLQNKKHQSDRRARRKVRNDE